MTGPVDLRAGACTARIHPDDGGRLAQLDLGAGPLLRGPAPDRSWDAWGCYPLLPWSNRIPGGHLQWDGIDTRLPVNLADGSAIHGLVATVPWEVDGRSEAGLQLSVDVATDPYRLHATLRYALSPGELTLRLSAENRGPGSVPVGLGIHPWFRAGAVRVPAEQAWPGEPLPTGPPVAVDADTDLRVARVPPPMDRCYTSLTGDRAEVPGAVLAWEGPVTAVVVYSGTAGWVAVEPVTMANDGFGLAHRGVPGHGVQVVAPGDRLAVTYRFQAAA